MFEFCLEALGSNGYKYCVNIDKMLEKIIKLRMTYFRILFSTIATLVIASTIYSLTSKDPSKILTAFSLHTNGKKIFEYTSSRSLFNCLHGIRAISAIQVIYFHRNGYSQLYAMSPAELRFARSGRMAVDTFFVIGAMLQTISILKGIENKNLNILRMLWKRYMRYTPAVMGAMFLYILHPLFMEALMSDLPLNCRNNFKWHYLVPLIQNQNGNYWFNGYFW